MGYIKLDKDRVRVDNEDLKWLKQWQWKLHSMGYAYRYESIEGKPYTILMHRVILKAKKGQGIDHINHNKLDNRKMNLRFVNQSQNNMNKSIQSNNSTGFIGVYFNKQRGHFQAYIKANNKHIYLGKFDDPKEASKKYKEAAKDYFGEFANL